MLGMHVLCRLAFTLHAPLGTRVPASRSTRSFSSCRLPGIPLDFASMHYWAVDTNHGCRRCSLLLYPRACGTFTDLQCSAVQYEVLSIVVLTSFVATLGSHAGTDDAVLEQQRLTLPVSLAASPSCPSSSGSAVCTLVLCVLSTQRGRGATSPPFFPSLPNALCIDLESRWSSLRRPLDLPIKSSSGKKASIGSIQGPIIGQSLASLRLKRRACLLVSRAPEELRWHWRLRAQSTSSIH